MLFLLLLLVFTDSRARPSWGASWDTRAPCSSLAMRGDTSTGLAVVALNTSSSSADNAEARDALSSPGHMRTTKRPVRACT